MQIERMKKTERENRWRKRKFEKKRDKQKVCKKQREKTDGESENFRKRRERWVERMKKPENKGKPERDL